MTFINFCPTHFSHSQCHLALCAFPACPHAEHWDYTADWCCTALYSSPLIQQLMCCFQHSFGSLYVTSTSPPWEDSLDSFCCKPLWHVVGRLPNAPFQHWLHSTAADVPPSPGTKTIQWNSQSKRMLGHHMTARSHLQDEIFLDIISGSFAGLMSCCITAPHGIPVAASLETEVGIPAWRFALHLCWLRVFSLHFARCDFHKSSVALICNEHLAVS